MRIPIQAEAALRGDQRRIRAANLAKELGVDPAQFDFDDFGDDADDDGGED